MGQEHDLQELRCTSRGPREQAWYAMPGVLSLNSTSSPIPTTT